jgi:O-antigen ligase
MIVVSIISIYESLSGNYIVPSYDYYLFTYNMFGLYRPKAIFYNTNNLTVFFVTCLPIAMYAAEHWKYRNIAKIVITILTVTVVLLTGSRTGVIALLLFCAFYLYYMLYYANHSKIVLLFIIVVIIAGIIIFFTPQLYQYITGGNSMGDEDRLPIWECAFKACKEYWFMGAGPGTSAYVNGSMGLTHNYSLEICLEFGIVGLVVFLFVIKSIILPSKKIKKDCLLMYFRSFIWIFLICTICPSSMQGYYYIWVIFGVCLAVKNIS